MSLRPASYRQMETDTLLANGQAAGYGLGVFLGSQNGHRMVEHGGGVPGFAAENMTFPDDRAAIVVLTNEASSAHTAIARQIVPLLLALAAAPAAPPALEQARKIFENLQQGKIDRSFFTADANDYFSEQALTDYAGGLGSLGKPTAFTQTGYQLRGGMTRRAHTVRCETRTLRVVTLEMPDGRLQQYVVVAA